MINWPGVLALNEQTFGRFNIPVLKEFAIPKNG
jgi:hypothetical protein